jgi:tRNA(Ile)-lysidine synthetase-like protein
MPQKPQDILRKFNLSLKLGPGEAVLCAASGGADSLCLLALLHEAGLAVSALHCDHGLRGKESVLDAAAVEKFCRRRDIPFILFKKKIGKGSGLEERSRRWRRACYAQAAKKIGARFVFLGHHARDQAETLILNLARGSGLKGSLAMQPLAPLERGHAQLARPFLEVEPQALKAELKKRGIRWREDASNADTGFARNAIRHRILPVLENLLPRATLHLAAFTRRAHEGGLPGIDDKGLQRVRELLAKGRGEADLKHGLALEASAGSLRLKPKIKVERRAVGKDWRPEPNAFWFSDVTLAKQLKVRGARAGDRFRPFGMKGSRLVFDLLAEHKVPAWRREGWPLLTASKGALILGVLGLRQADQHRIRRATRQALRVTWASFDKAQALC